MNENTTENTTENEENINEYFKQYFKENTNEKNVEIKSRQEQDDENIFIEISYKKNIVRYFANTHGMYTLYTHIYTILALYQYAHIYVPLYGLSLFYNWMAKT